VKVKILYYMDVYHCVMWFTCYLPEIPVMCQKSKTETFSLNVDYCVDGILVVTVVNNLVMLKLPAV